jgi:hypothetical protein
MRSAAPAIILTLILSCSVAAAGPTGALLLQTDEAADEPAGGGKGAGKGFLSKFGWTLGGFIGVAFPTAATGDMSPGIELAFQATARIDLAKGKDFPFPAIFPLRLEFKYIGGDDLYFDPLPAPGSLRRTDVSSVLILFKIDFGLDLLWKVKNMMLFPFVGAGSGFETVVGSKVGYDGTDIVFTFQFGLGFAFFINEDIFLLGRFEYSPNLNADNVAGNFSLNGGFGIRVS